MTGIRLLNHAVLFVSDLDRALAFYREVLGFELVSHEERMNAAFVRAAGYENHHDLGLFGLGDAAARQRPGQTGLKRPRGQAPVSVNGAQKNGLA